MIGVRNCVAQLLLRLPFQLASSRELPVAGKWIHRLNHRLPPSEEKVWSRVRPGPTKGIWLEVNPRTGHDYIQGLTEAATQRRVVEYLRPGMVFYDLGANIGLFSLLAARIVGPSGKLFSFEPDFEAARRVRRNVERNKFSNITVVEAGAWSSTGRANFVAAASFSPDRNLADSPWTRSSPPGLALLATLLTILFAPHRRRTRSSVTSRVQNWKCFATRSAPLPSAGRGLCARFTPRPIATGYWSSIAALDTRLRSWTIIIFWVSLREVRCASCAGASSEGSSRVQRYPCLGRYRRMLCGNQLT